MKGFVRLNWTSVLTVAALVYLAGCGMDLETGYKYRPLGASVVERRGYYASPYSPEKTAAEQEHKQNTPTLGGAATN